MFLLTFSVVCWSLLWTSHGKSRKFAVVLFALANRIVLVYKHGVVFIDLSPTEKPLSEYIKKYETLSYSTSALTRQHERHRRSTTPHSSPILLNFEADGR